MSWHNIKIRRTDALFSRYLRKKRGYKCDYHGNFYPEGRGLEISHFWSRRHEGTRFDEENCDVLCREQHRWFGEHRTEYEAWKKAKLGTSRYDLLDFRAHQVCKRDDKAILMWLKALETNDQTLTHV